MDDDSLNVDPARLTAATGFRWTSDSKGPYFKESRASLDDGRACRVVVTFPGESDGLFEWDSTEIVRHPDASRHKDGEHYMILTAFGTVRSSAEEAARRAVAYRAERRVMAGHVWYAGIVDFENGKTVRKRTWLCPMAGREIRLMECRGRAAWEYAHPFPEIRPLFVAAGEPYLGECLRGKASGPNEAAAAALAAPARFRQDIAAYAADLLCGLGGAYASGLADGRAALLADVATLGSMPPGRAEPVLHGGVCDLEP